ncbi:HNH endonuclease signature motif containing protein [Nitrosomonas sp.]|uniref:HNH endonuclease n=1 Tax=Nitrosomonas sp. TaxID=42353 RepID=UPI0025D72FD2|nr:HNH endonuclease signature motif containing protein [Nitrosomonas sp.]
MLVHGVSKCDKHKNTDRKAYDHVRGSSADRGYGHKWRKARDLYLGKNQCCVKCESLGFVENAVIVDHKIPPKLKEAKDNGDPDRIRISEKLMWDRKNWQALCKSCHDRKTATEDGGFGRYRGGQKS